MASQVSDSQPPVSQIAIGQVKSVTAKVVVISETGLQRTVEVGDLLFQNDKVTSQGETVIEFTDGSQVILGNTDQIILTEEVFSTEASEDIDVEASTDIETLQKAQSKLTHSENIEANIDSHQGTTSTYVSIDRDVTEVVTEAEQANTAQDKQKALYDKKESLFVQDILTEDLILFNSVNQLANNKPEIADQQIVQPIIADEIISPGATPPGIDDKVLPFEKVIPAKKDIENNNPIVEVQKVESDFIAFENSGKLISDRELLALYKGPLKENLFIEDVDIDFPENGSIYRIDDGWEFIPASGFFSARSSEKLKLLVTVSNGNGRDEIEPTITVIPKANHAQVKPVHYVSFDIYEDDKLDLRDLLVGEPQENIDQYLSLESDSYSTSINVRSEAGGEVTQVITLEGTNLNSYYNTDNQTEILNNLINDGHLIID